MDEKKDWQKTQDERHRDLMKHYPWVSSAEDKRPPLQTDDLEKILRSILDSGNWGDRVSTLREWLKKLGVSCE